MKTHRPDANLVVRGGRLDSSVSRSGSRQPHLYSVSRAREGVLYVSESACRWGSVGRSWSF